MIEDTFMVVAFGLFLLLIVFRLRQHHKEKQKQVESSQKRILFTVIRLLILGGLLLYMLLVLWEDLDHINQIKGDIFFLRCLIFVITIYILILSIKELFWRKSKENMGK